MKVTYFFAGLLLLSFSTAFSQSVYHFQYNFNQPADSVKYHAFLMRYNDGSGLLRVRYTSPATKQDILVEADIEESYPADSVPAKASTGPLFLTPVNPRFIIGDNNIKFNTPFFYFTYNRAAGFYEPAGVTMKTANTVMAARTTFVAALMERPALTKSFVAAFFSADEDFYINLFRTGTKGLTEAEKSTRLFLLAVADTLDEEIGPACSRDLLRTLETFKAITGYMGIKYIPKTIAGATYSIRNVQLAVKELRPGANDIVVFYYSGHGFRKQEENRRFPNIKLKTKHTSRTDVFQNSMNIEDIFVSIQKKPSRFNLVLSDCCNSDIEITNAIGSKPGQTKSSGIEWNEDNCRSLFLNKARMSVLATSADNGQKAVGNNEFGSFFSFFLKTSLENYCSKLKTKPTWDQVLQETKTQTIYKAKHTYCERPFIPENICNQYPYYIIR